MSNIEIKVVKTKKDLNDFINFPMKLYKDNEFFVPPLVSNEKEMFDRKKNHSYEYCESIEILAYKDNEVVAVVEIIVMHTPSIDTLKYYREHNILCLQIKLSTFEDCDNIEVKLTHPTSVNNYNCNAPLCETCCKPLHNAYLLK